MNLNFGLERDFTPGTQGAIWIGGYEFPFATWTVEMVSNPIPLPTNSSVGYVNTLPGLKTYVCNASGVYNSDFNPFRKFAFLGTYKDLYLKIDFFNTATMPSALISRWIFRSESDGTATWALTAIGDYKFHDFSESDA